MPKCASSKDFIDALVSVLKYILAFSCFLMFFVSGLNLSFLLLKIFGKET